MARPTERPRVPGDAPRRRPGPARSHWSLRGSTWARRAASFSDRGHFSSATVATVRYRAVIFDLGGVVLGSPLRAIAGFERDRGLPRGFIARVVGADAQRGAWSRLERGELDLEGFYGAFERDCAEAGRAVDARALMERIGGASQPRPQMVEAVRRVRSRGLRAAALTNNWTREDGDAIGALLRDDFDVFLESRALGLRKPDPRVYTLACEKLGVEPPEAVFLDDIGGNLKPARALGIHTIKVDDPDRALQELERALGFPLRARGRR